MCLRCSSVIVVWKLFLFPISNWKLFLFDVENRLRLEQNDLCSYFYFTIPSASAPPRRLDLCFYFVSISKFQIGCCFYFTIPNCSLFLFYNLKLIFVSILQFEIVLCFYFTIPNCSLFLFLNLKLIFVSISKFQIDLCFYF
jgi:hypothetical protein